MTENDLLLPTGTRLLHIGPSKTGTTAIQGALKQARREMTAHGVLYPGTDRQHWRAARAVLGTPGPKGDPPVAREYWDRMVRDVAAAGDRRVVLSAEAFSAADGAGARRVVDDLGGPRVHVVVTLRPLAKMLPSIWQQSVRQGLCASYESWLARMLPRATADGDRPRFWQRHRQDLLVERWAAVVGPDNLTVVVLDESDHLMLLRSFERLLGLPAGLLRPERKTNPSLSFGEVEFVRLLNKELFDRGWSYRQHRDWVRKGLLPHLQDSERQALAGQRIGTPSWAGDCIAELGVLASRHITDSGVRVVGDVTTLASRPAAPSASEPEALVPARTAAHAIVGTILTARKTATPAPRRGLRVPNRVPRPWRVAAAGVRRPAPALRKQVNGGRRPAAQARPAARAPQGQTARR